MSDLLLMDALDLKIYDNEGRLVTEIDHNVKSVLSLGKREFGINNILLNLDLLKTLGKDEVTNELSDFEKALNTKTVIKLSKDSNLKSYKIIANGILYSPETNSVSHKFNLVIYNARISRSHDISFEATSPYSPSFLFKLDEDDNGEYVDLVLEEA